MAKRAQFSPEVRERAVRFVEEQEQAHRSQWAAIGAIAPKFGGSAPTLRHWIQRREVDRDRVGV